MYHLHLEVQCLLCGSCFPLHLTRSIKVRIFCMHEHKSTYTSLCQTYLPSVFQMCPCQVTDQLSSYLCTQVSAYGFQSTFFPNDVDCRRPARRPGSVHSSQRRGTDVGFCNRDSPFVPSFRALDCSDFIGISDRLYRQFFTTDYISVKSTLVDFYMVRQLYVTF